LFFCLWFQSVKEQTICDFNNFVCQHCSSKQIELGLVIFQANKESFRFQLVEFERKSAFCFTFIWYGKIHHSNRVILKYQKSISMEALVYTFLLVGTLGIIFFAIFFRDPPRIVK